MKFIKNTRVLFNIGKFGPCDKIGKMPQTAPHLCLNYKSDPCKFNKTKRTYLLFSKPKPNPNLNPVTPQAHPSPLQLQPSPLPKN